MMNRLLLFTLALVLCVVTPATGAKPADFYSEVIDMLEADLSEEVVLDWLTGVESSPPHPTPEELIAVKKAGGTDRLLKALIALSRGADTSNGAAPAAAPPTSQLAPASLPGTLVTFKLAYEAPKVDFDEELWDLYVYLDGEPLAYVPPSFSVLDREKALEFRQRLTPGEHVIRVAQERHERHRRSRWHHSARVSGQAFTFKVLPDRPAELELSYREGWLSNHSDGPLRFRFIHDEEVAELEWVGGDPEGWPLLCEELESNQDSDKEPGRALLRELENCVRWDELWRDTTAPSRAEVREAMELFDYRPVPRGT